MILLCIPCLSVSDKEEKFYNNFDTRQEEEVPVGKSRPEALPVAKSGSPEAVKKQGPEVPVSQQRPTPFPGTEDVEIFTAEPRRRYSRRVQRSPRRRDEDRSRSLEDGGPEKDGARGRDKVEAEVGVRIVVFFVVRG